jgi:putative hydrolase of the HAD superfamily
MSMPPLRAVLLDAVGTTIHLREPVGATYARVAGGGDPAALQRAFGEALRSRPPMVFGELDGDGVRAAEREWWRALVESGVRRRRRDAARGRLRPTLGSLRRRRRLAGGTGRARAAARPAPAEPAHRDGLELRPPPGRGAGGAGPESAARRRRPAVPCRRRKARRRIFHLAVAMLGIEPAEALYVGDDAEDDIAGAGAAGLRVVDVAGVTDLTQLLAECGA